MVVSAAHTGARRSELMGSRIDDIDFDAETVTIRDEKRVRGKRKTRVVPLSPVLKDTLWKWINGQHAGGQKTFHLPTDVARYKLGQLRGVVKYCNRD